MTSCRYCQFFAVLPDCRTEGHCAAFMPPRRISLPFDGCPYDNDAAQIKSSAAAHGFTDDFLRHIMFSGSARGRQYKSIEDLKAACPNISEGRALYIDLNGHVFRTALFDLAAADCTASDYTPEVLRRDTPNWRRISGGNILRHLRPFLGVVIGKPAVTNYLGALAPFPFLFCVASLLVWAFYRLGHACARSYFSVFGH